MNFQPVLLLIGEHTFVSRKLELPCQLSIGRLEDCDIVIETPTLSRRHAVLHAEAGPHGVPRFAIEDCGSSNGVFVAGAQLAPLQPAPLQPGQAVELGGMSLLVQLRPREDAGQPGAEPSSEPQGGAIAITGEQLGAPSALLDRISDSLLNVLILGETGVGKEVLARALHERSARRRGPFLPLNCAALAESVLEAELFGYERGAFTGAVKAKPGLLESADGGTVLLDEIGEMPLPTQAKLLRFLERREVLRIGGLAPRTVDVRVLSATHRQLSGPDAHNGFREDLFFRLDGVTLWVPPLRERVGEILPLARRFLAEASSGQAPALSPAAERRLLAYRFPGNVRELRNVIQRAVVLCGGGAIQPEHLRLVGDAEPRAAVLDRRRPLPVTIKERSVGRASQPPPEPVPPRSGPGAGSGAGAGLPAPPVVRAPRAARAGALSAQLGAISKQAILDELARCAGNQSQAAQRLGIPRRTFLKRLDEFQIPRPRKRDAETEPDTD